MLQAEAVMARVKYEPWWADQLRVRAAHGPQD